MDNKQFTSPRYFTIMFSKYLTVDRVHIFYSAIPLESDVLEAIQTIKNVSAITYGCKSHNIYI